MEMKRIMVAMMAASAVALSACSDDDDDENDDESNIEEITESDITAGNHIDLGLSVEWASFNLGGQNPEDDGGFYAWGETEEKDTKTYNWAGYKYCTASDTTMTKYNEADGLTVLKAEDDAATVRLGDKWRIPTYAECTELTDNCDVKWVKYAGAYGYLFTSTINGNSIFIPAAGFLSDEGELCNHWSQGATAAKGCYWSSTLDVRNDSQAKDLFFYYPDYVHGDYDQWYRYAAQPIRAVYEE